MSKEQIEEFSCRIHAAVWELEQYKGDMIVAGEHPLHKTIVAVECLCVQRKPLGVEFRQVYSLPFSVAKIWYALLNVSRSLDIRDHMSQGLPYDLNDILPKPRQRRLKMLVMMLIVALNGINETLNRYEKTGKLPYVLPRVEAMK